MPLVMPTDIIAWSRQGRQREESDEEEKMPFVASDGDVLKGDWPVTSRSLSSVGAIFFWQVLAIAFACLSLFLFFRTSPADNGGFEHGFPTEIDAAKAVLSTHQIVFDGGPTFHENGTEYLRPTKGKKYIGEPNQEMDENWTELTQDRWFLLSEDEARRAWRDDYQEFWDEYAGGYLATIDTMHMIHCLDHIRKSFYPEYYGTKEEGVHGSLHRDHCIDALRQMLMCKADMTPLPTRWYPKALSGIHYVDSDRPHTCRDWNAVRQWVTSRTMGPDAVRPNHSPGHEQDWRDY